MPYAIGLDLRGRAVLVVGGGKVATRKVVRLLDERAVIRLVSPDVSQSIEQWATEERLTLYKRPYQAKDLVGMQLVFATTNNPSVNAQVVTDAHQRGLWVNVADSTTPGDFTLPAIATFGPLQLAIDTGGGAPALSRRLRQHLAETFDPGWGRGAAIFTALRPLVRPLYNEEIRRRFWRSLARDLPHAALGSKEELVTWITHAAQESGLILDKTAIHVALQRALADL